ncbi:MAG: SLC13 family permease [Arenicellales bacterium]|nr:SLC13 family permease [Arenicellales bacterium]
MPLATEHLTLFGLLLAVFGFLLWGRVRYDLVAFTALVLALIVGVVPVEAAFSGFGHPATVIIALVLIVSRGLFNSGVVEAIAQVCVAGVKGVGAHIGLMSGVGGLLSAVMNNVAALSLLMPVDIEAARKAERSPGLTLMPLSFATILGGMVTLIGTPPNIVVATVREEALGDPFRMFDFAPVGFVVAVAGVLFVALAGWRLLPSGRRKENPAVALADLAGYVFETSVTENSKLIGAPLREAFPLAEEHDVVITGLIRNHVRLAGSARREIVKEGDILVLEGAAESIEQFVGAARLGSGDPDKKVELLGESMALAEAVVPVGARIAGRSATDLRLAYRHGVMLLGVSRRGRSFRERVRKLRILPGDILLLYGVEDRLDHAVQWLGCLALADRGLTVLQRQKAGLAIGTFALAILAASVGWLYLSVALGAVVVVYVVFGLVKPTEVYESVEWPVIVLLGSLIPIGSALESSGGTALIAQWILSVTQGLAPVMVLAILMIVTMSLSDVLNNVATALIAAPIGLEIAGRLELNPDPFLMAVAVAASCAFLTPIGHKNNTIVMGPGGYRFGDYWRMGLPLEILVVAVSLPAILFFWPLAG